jgi:hypothetical protein
MKLIRPILSLSLCFLVLLSSSSFTIGIHLCENRVQNVALFKKAKSCQNETLILPCHKHKTKECCQDETIVHNADDSSVIANDIHVNSSFPLLIGINQASVLISELIPSPSVSANKYFNYDPPLRSSDLIVIFQNFLI